MAAVCRSTAGMCGFVNTAAIPAEKAAAAAGRKREPLSEEQAGNRILTFIKENIK